MQCNWYFCYTTIRCENEATITGMCEEHTEKCSNPKCDNMAVEACDFAGQFVCGYPICGKCDHKERHYKKPSPTFYLLGGHLHQ